jgi:hypothetical protein
MAVEVMRHVLCSNCGVPVVDSRIQTFLTQVTPATCWNCKSTRLVMGEKDVKTGPLRYDEASGRWSEAV